MPFPNESTASALPDGESWYLDTELKRSASTSLALAPGNEAMVPARASCWR